MTDETMTALQVLLEDGRYLVYYTFPEAQAPLPSASGTDAPPADDEPPLV